jgi:hypothetical protein
LADQQKQTLLYLARKIHRCLVAHLTSRLSLDLVVRDLCLCLYCEILKFNFADSDQINASTSLGATAQTSTTEATPSAKPTASPFRPLDWREVKPCFGQKVEFGHQIFHITKKRI